MLFQKSSWEFDTLPATNSHQTYPHAQEEECLLRLKTQRKHIEELTQKYTSKEKELGEAIAREKELEERNQELEGFSQYRDMYDALKVEFERVYAQAELDGFHARETQQELEEALSQAQQVVEQMKAQLRGEKEDRRLEKMQWQMVLEEKEEMLRKERHESVVKEEEMKSKIELLKEENTGMRKQLKQSGQQLRGWSQQRRRQLQSKQLGLMSCQKQAQYWKKQATLLKHQLETLVEEHEVELSQKQHDNSIFCQQIQHYRQLSTQLATEKDQLALSLTQANTKAHNLQSQLRREAERLSRQQSRDKCGLPRPVEPYQQEKQLLRSRKELEQAVNQCNLLLTDNRRLRALLDMKGERRGRISLSGESQATASDWYSAS